MTRWPIPRIAKLLAILLIADVSFFGFLNPLTGNSLTVIMGCLLLGLTLYAIFRIILRLPAAFIMTPQATQKRLAAFVAGLLMFLLLMQSIGQLSGHDVLAGVVLAVVLYLYVSYISDGYGKARSKVTRTDTN